MRFTRVSNVGVISPLLNKPFNRPTFDASFTKEDFEKEYERAIGSVRQCLEIFGPVGSYGNKGISLGPPTNSRKIGIVLDSEEYFRPELLSALAEAVDAIPEHYLVYIDGEDEAENAFYFCIRKDGDILAYADTPEALSPFERSK